MPGAEYWFPRSGDTECFRHPFTHDALSSFPSVSVAMGMGVVVGADGGRKVEEMKKNLAPQVQCWG